MSSKTAGERIAARYITSDWPGHFSKRALAMMVVSAIDAAIRRAVAADRRKRGKKTKGAKRWTRLGQMDRGGGTNRTVKRRAAK